MMIMAPFIFRSNASASEDDRVFCSVFCLIVRPEADVRAGGEGEDQEKGKERKGEKGTEGREEGREEKLERREGRGVDP